MFQEFREQKEREVAELIAIKGDLEVRLHRVSEEGGVGDQGDSSGHLIGQLMTSLLDYCTTFP